jgi:hypothetical protein
MAADIIRKLGDGLRNAFKLEGPHGPLTEQDRQLLARLAGAIVARGMAVPAVLFLRSVLPLNSLGSQAMVFLRPFLVGFIAGADYDRIIDILDRREGIEALIEAIEAAEPLEKDRTK